jgi:hypothetical protein
MYMCVCKVSDMSLVVNLFILFVKVVFLNKKVDTEHGDVIICIKQHDTECGERLGHGLGSPD